MNDSKFEINQFGALIGYCCAVVILIAILNSMAKSHIKVTSPASPSSSTIQAPKSHK